MIRLVLFLLGVLVIATGLSWLADQPGTLKITFQEYVIETSVFRAVVIFVASLGLAALAWSVMRQIWSSPAAVGHFLTRRRQRRGLDALSSGMIAVGAGDRGMATRYALQARKSLPNEPLTHLLRAQAAQLSGDKATARRIFEAMLGAPDTEQLGLRGLYLEASREEETEAQRQFAERAFRLNPKLAWPVEALFTLQCKVGDWAGALDTLATARRHGHIEKPLADRRRAVLLTAQAQALEDEQSEKALTMALEAHNLAPTLIPAAAVAGRLLAARGNTARAAKVIQRTWSSAPHPELATAYAYARVGDSPRDRLDRVKHLAMVAPNSIESWIAVAIAAIEAHDYAEARQALAPFTDGRMTRRVATLMARIEAEESGDKGRAREWLARAAIASRDATWTADGIVSDRWAAVSPVTHTLDAFAWRVPVEESDPSLSLASAGLDELMAMEEPGKTIVAEASAPASPVSDRAGPIEVEAVGEAQPGQPRVSKAEAERARPGKARSDAVAAATVSAIEATRAPDDPGPLDDDEMANPRISPHAT